MGRLWSFFFGSDPVPLSTIPAPPIKTIPKIKKWKLTERVLAYFLGSEPGSGEAHIDIEVKHLSAIWLRYNEEQDPVGAGKIAISSCSRQKAGSEGALQLSQGLPANPLFLEFIGPYEQIYRSQNALEGAIEIADYLEQHGDCPSVASHFAGKDSEIQEIQTIREPLLKITLKNHSSRVARLMLKTLKDTYQEADLLIPKAVVTALGHDLGKIPVLSEGKENLMTDHPLLSVLTMEKIFIEVDPQPVWLIEVIEAIKSHHSKSRDEWTLLLKHADNEARNLEISEINRQLSPRAWEDWFKADELIKLLAEYINVRQPTGKLRAFSFGEAVYCNIDYLVDSALRQAYQKRVIDVTLIKETEKTSALRRIVSSLKQARLVTDDIRENDLFRKYHITGDRIHLLNTLLIPLKLKAFGDPSALENAKNKDEYLKRIQAVNLVP